MNAPQRHNEKIIEDFHILNQVGELSVRLSAVGGQFEYVFNGTRKVHAVTKQNKGSNELRVVSLVLGIIS